MRERRRLAPVAPHGHSFTGRSLFGSPVDILDTEMKTLLLPTVLFVAIATAAICPAAFAADPPSPLLTKPGLLLLSEDFSGAALPPKWQPGGRPNCFSVVEGALQGVCPPDDHHGPAISVPIDGRNLTIQFSVKLAKGLLL